MGEPSLAMLKYQFLEFNPIPTLREPGWNVYFAAGGLPGGLPVAGLRAQSSLASSQKCTSSLDLRHTTDPFDSLPSEPINEASAPCLMPNCATHSASSPGVTHV